MDNRSALGVVIGYVLEKTTTNNKKDIDYFVSKLPEARFLSKSVQLTDGVSTYDVELDDNMRLSYMVTSRESGIAFNVDAEHLMVVVPEDDEYIRDALNYLITEINDIFNKV